MNRNFLSTLVVFALFLLAPIPVDAAITLTQHAGKDAGTVTSSSLAFASNNAPGNFVAIVVRGGRSGAIITVGDTRGNTYRQAALLNITLDTPNGDTLAIFYAENIAGGTNSVTVTQSVLATLRFAILEYSGVAIVNSLDGAVAVQANSLFPNSGNVVTTSSGDLLLGAVMSANERTFTAGAGFTIQDRVPAAPNTKVISEDRIQASAGSAAATATLSASDIWGAALAAFRPAAAISAPDLGLSKSHAGSFTQGQINAAYSIVVSNSGAGPTVGTVMMTDTLPSGLTATSLSGTGWNCTVVPASCSRSDVLASGASYSAITLTVNVASNAPGTLTNTASINGGGETNTANNSVSDVTTINPVPDLTLTKTHSGAFTQGQTGASYTVTVTNSGQGATSGTVTMSDTLPSGLSAISLSGTGWNCTVVPASCSRSDVLASGASYPAITLTVSIASDAPSNLTNTASVSGGGEINPANNSSSDVTTINLLDTISPSAPGTLSGTAPNGTRVDLSWGPATDNVGVTSYQVARCNGTCSIVDGGFVQIGSPTSTGLSDSSLAPGTTYSYVVRALDGAGNTGPYSNIVTLTTPATIPELVVAFSFDETSGTTVIDSSGQGNIGTIANAPRTLGIFGNALSFNGTDAKVSVPDTLTLHLTTSMTLEAWVNPTTVTSAWRDIIEKGDDNYFLMGTTTFGGVPGGGGVFGGVNTTAPGAVPLQANTWTHLATTYDGAALRFYVNAVQVSSVTRTGLMTTSTSPLEIGGDTLYGQYFRGLIDEVRIFNVARTPTQILSDMNSPIGAAFPVASLSPGSVNFGSVSTGIASSAQNVVLTNSGGVALAITGISVTGINSSDFSQSNNCGASLPSSASCTIAVLFTPAATGTRTASITIDDNAVGSPHLVALTGTGVTSVVPDLTLTKTHTGAFSQGQTGATYSLVVRNSGTASTSGTVTVIDILPTGLTATGMSGTGWSCTLSSRTCSRSTSLAANSNYPTITLTVSVASNAPESVTNAATVNGGGETNSSNNSASDLTIVNATPAPDLTLTKTHTGTFTQGQTGATYSLVVRNSGTVSSSGTVTVTDTLPTGLTATAMSGSGWSCTLSSRTCSRSATLAPNSNYSTITLTVSVASNAAASVTNTATVGGGGETNTSNNSASDVTTINAGPTPDLTLTKTHTGAFTQGQPGAAYSLVVRNSGTASTSGTVTVVDTLPTGLTATAMSGTGWSCTLSSRTCTRSTTLGSNSNYPTITLTVSVASNAPGSVTNTATVTGGGETNTSNNSAIDITTVNPGPTPDLTLTKTHTGAFRQGQTGATYSLVVRNSGTASTSGTVTVVDTLPAGLTATSMSGTGWTCSFVVLTCTQSSPLAANSNYPAITLTVSVASDAPASVTNAATVSGGGETNSTNNSASDVTAVSVPDIEAPGTPGTLSGIAPNGTHVDLIWGPATDNVGVTGYRVERCDGLCTVAGGGFVKIAAPTATSFSDSVLVPNTTYSYVVRAEDAASNLGPYSNVVTLTTLATIPELVVAFSFDEPSGITVTDSSDKGNTGTIANATRTLGKYGSALSFNGTNAKVSVPDASTLHLTTAMTLEAWVKPSTVSSAWRDIIEKGNDNYFLMGTTTFGGAPGGGGIFGGVNMTAPGTSPLATNTWTHLATTYDGATLRLYVGGVEVSTVSRTGTMTTSTSPLELGGDTLFGQFFQGLIDEVRIYNIALTPTQILSDMNSPIGSSFPFASLNPTSINFGSVATGIPSSPQVVTLTNPGGVALSISGISITGVNNTEFSQSSNCGASLAASSSCTMAVTFTPSATGAKFASIRIDDNAAGTPHLVALAGAGVGFSVAPRISVLTPAMEQQFGVISGSGGAVSWSVDGIPGGSPETGTVSVSGLYSPPPEVGTHTVTVEDQAQTSSATVHVTAYPGTLTHHNDNARTGQNLNETVLTPTNVNPGAFGKLLSYDLDGLSIASPLYVPGVIIPDQGIHNVVFVATEHDSVYAFDADGLVTSPIWKRSFLGPGITTVPATDTGECCDISPEIGITGTPVIDPSTNTLYVVAKTKEGANYFQRLHALDITTGSEKPGGWPITLQASVPGNGQGSSGGQIPFNALRENQRPALLLNNGVVYIAFGSHGDVQPYHGWVLGYDVTTLQQTMAINVSPNADGGGIWQANGGPAADANGNIYVITGNGAFTADSGNGKDYGDTFVKISSTGATAGTIVDYFTPYDQASINAANFDLGAAGPLLLPDQPGAHPHLMISAGKNNTIYLVDRDNMGHINSANNDNQIVQSLVNIFPFGTPEPGNYSGAVYFNGRVYFGPIADNIQAFQLTNGLLSTSAVARSQAVYKYPGATMAISSNGTANGLLWAIQRNGDCGVLLTCSSATAGVLRAYDTSTPGGVLTQVYSSDQMGTRDTLDFATKFSVPLVANGKVFVASMSKLTVFGLLP